MKCKKLQALNRLNCFIVWAIRYVARRKKKIGIEFSFFVILERTEYRTRIKRRLDCCKITSLFLLLFVIHIINSYLIKVSTNTVTVLY